MFSTDGYIKLLNQKEIRRQRWTTYYFGLIYGLVLLFISIFRLITDNNINNDKFYFFLLILSIIDFLILIFLPSKLTYLKKGISIIGKFIFRILISMLLLVIYIIWFIPASIIFNIRGKDKVISLKTKNTKVVKMTNNNVFCQIKNIFSYFLFEGSWYLIPLIIILVVIGLILFFAQSSAITPLIYPLI